VLDDSKERREDIMNRQAESRTGCAMMCVIWKLLLVWLLFLALGGCGNQDLLHLSACNSQRLTAHVLWADTNAEDYALMATVYSYTTVCLTIVRRGGRIS
jgi:hypothetical protein